MTEMGEREDDSVNPESNVEVPVDSSSSVEPLDAGASSLVSPPPEKVDKSTNTELLVQKHLLFLIVHSLISFFFLGISKTTILFKCDSI